MPVSTVKLVDKYNINGPRYTSYPTALELTELELSKPESVTNQINAAIAASDNDELSIYVHIPFCKQLCYYCGCHKYLKRENDETVTRYLDKVKAELKNWRAIFDIAKYQVRQIHFGGGTPTFASNEQLSDIVDTITTEFSVLTDAEVSIEIDPRTCNSERLMGLIAIGFNRFSFGVQDFNLDTQIAINRVQTEQSLIELANVIKAARDRQGKPISFNFDLIYGLPNQTLESFNETLNKIIAIKPHRLSVFNYAHMPDKFAEQRRINTIDLPDANSKLQIQLNTIDKLTSAGYIYLGIDHFALPDDSLAIEQAAKRLHRNFQGYTTHGHCDMLAVGCSAISQFGNLMLQNEKRIGDYEQAVDKRHYACIKYLEKSPDDELRWQVIKQLICNMELDIQAFEQENQIDFSNYFSEELAALKSFIQDQLINLTTSRIEITEQGRLFSRQICKVFDQYLRTEQQFSKAI